MTSTRHDHRLILQVSMLVATREVCVRHFSEIWVNWSGARRGGALHSVRASGVPVDG